MFSDRFHRLSRTLSFRLTVLYSGMAAISIILAFLILYLVFSSLIRERTDQHLVNEAKEFASLYRAKGLDTASTSIVLEAESEGVDNLFCRILTGEGKMIASSNLSSWSYAGISRAALKRLAEGEDHVIETLTPPHKPHSARVIYRPLGPGVILQMGSSSEHDDRFLDALSQVFVIPIVTLLLLSALVGWFMAKRALQGVEKVTQTAMEISSGAFDRRVPLMDKGEEIDRLAHAFNRMLDRITALISVMREVTDNIAHDLRTPIARMRGIAEIALTNGQAQGDSALMAAAAIEECDRLLGMINTMLDISEAEAGASLLCMQDLDLAKIVRDASDIFLPLAEDKGIRIVSDLPERLFLKGDMVKLQRMVANLLDNAIKYTPSGGTVTLAVEKGERKITLFFSDTGIGISQEDLTRIFDRFYRCDRSRSNPGTGLGLSLARAIAHAHGGEISAASQLGGGSTFTVTLPG